MSRSAQLWSANADLAQAAREHPFVRGLADGSLPQPVFAHYVGQDAAFLEAFARAYALALVHSADTATLLAFADLLAGVRDELRLHDGYAARWGVDLAAVQPSAATLAYTEFLLATAVRGDVGLTCAAMTPCMRLYAFLGQSLEGTAGPYEEWVATYADPEFEALARELERLLDAHGSDGAAGPYRRAMQLEVAFFDAALRAG